MIALSKNASIALELLRQRAEGKTVIVAGKPCRRVQIDPKIRPAGMTPRIYAWAQSSLQHSGLLYDWPGDDRFAAVVVEE